MGTLMKIKWKWDEIFEMSGEELRAELERRYVRIANAKLADKQDSFGWEQNSYSLEKSSNTRTGSTSDSAQNVSFPSETNKNSQVHDTPKDCLEEINESVLSCMFDDCNESAQIDSDSVSHAEPINFSGDTCTKEENGHESDLCLMFDEIDSDSVSHAEPINFSCDTQEEDGHENDLCFMFEETNEVCINVESPVEIVDTGECFNEGVEVSLCVCESVSEDLKLNGCLGNSAVEAQELLLVCEDTNSRDFSEFDMNV